MAGSFHLELPCFAHWGKGEELGIVKRRRSTKMLGLAVGPILEDT